ncbi:MAG TPA: M23 family metallopeptidase [Clostridia bacterium]|nr:M23 family metallopeptidase [Clostridia bacterium]
MKNRLNYIINLLKSKYTFMIIPNSTRKSFQFSISKLLLITLVVSNFYYISNVTIKNYMLNKDIIQVTTKYNNTTEELAHYKTYSNSLDYTLKNQSASIDQLRNKLAEEKETYSTRLKELDELEESFVSVINKFNYENNFDVEIASSRSLSLGRESLENEDLVVDDEFTELINLDISEYNHVIEDIENKLNFLEAKPDLLPVSGRISSNYGWRRHPVTGGSDFHDAVDIVGNVGDDIKAAGAGIVTFSGYSGSYGKVIIISHGYGYKSVYAHNNKNLVPVGTEVKKGQVIAELGRTGRVTGAHVHFEIHKDGAVINPNDIIDF